MQANGTAADRLGLLSAALVAALFFIALAGCDKRIAEDCELALNCIDRHCDYFQASEDYRLLQWCSAKHCGQYEERDDALAYYWNCWGRLKHSELQPAWDEGCDELGRYCEDET